MTALDRVDCLPGAEGGAEVLLGQVKLRRPVGAEGNLAGVAVGIANAAPL
jgi:hypothetical protein